jgi:hypothetical protein
VWLKVKKKSPADPLFKVFIGQFLLCSQTDDDPQEDLALCGTKAKYENKNLKHPSIFFGYLLLNHVCIEI